MLRPPGQRRARAAPAAGDEGRDQGPRPAGPEPASLHAGRRRRGAGHGGQPVAGRVCRLVVMVAFFLTEKNWQLWPDVAADRRLYDALETGDYEAWHRYTTDQIEDSGQHEVLNWFCLLGRDGRTRPQTRQGHLHRELGLRLAGRLCVLPLRQAA